MPNWFDPPRVIIAAPVPLHDNLPNSSAYGIFDEQSVVKSKQLAQSFRSLAEMYRCDFADCGSVTTTTPEECVHLTAEAHDAIAKLLRDKIIDK